MYWSRQACPAERTKPGREGRGGRQSQRACCKCRRCRECDRGGQNSRSRASQSGLDGLKFMTYFQRASPMPAAPMTVPGWPPLYWREGGGGAPGGQPRSTGRGRQAGSRRRTCCVSSQPRTRTVLIASFSASVCEGQGRQERQSPLRCDATGGQILETGGGRTAPLMGLTAAATARPSCVGGWSLTLMGDMAERGKVGGGGVGGGRGRGGLCGRERRQTRETVASSLLRRWEGHSGVEAFRPGAACRRRGREASGSRSRPIAVRLRAT